MSNHPINLSGLWMGSYSYPGGRGPTTPFLARIEDDGGQLSGTIVEPNTIGPSSDTLEAALSDSREGSAVDFTKVYDGASDAAHAVDYVGRLSPDGNTVSGVWSLAEVDGTFEMYREAIWEEEAGEEAEVVKPLAEAEKSSAQHGPALHGSGRRSAATICNRNKYLVPGVLCVPGAKSGRCREP